MNDETEKYMERTITRLEEILAGNPWHVRDQLKLFVAKLKASRAQN